MTELISIIEISELQAKSMLCACNAVCSTYWPVVHQDGASVAGWCLPARQNANTADAQKHSSSQLTSRIRLTTRVHVHHTEVVPVSQLNAP